MPCWQKLLSDKKIKFKEFCVPSNKFQKSLPRESFKNFGKNVVSYEIYSKKIEGGEYLCPWTFYYLIHIKPHLKKKKKYFKDISGHMFM